VYCKKFEGDSLIVGGVSADSSNGMVAVKGYFEQEAKIQVIS
jgi:hypothetical protein